MTTRHVLVFENDYLFLSGRLLAEPGNSFTKTTFYVVQESVLLAAINASRTVQGLPEYKFVPGKRAAEYNFAHNRFYLNLSDITLVDCLIPPRGKFAVTVEEALLLTAMQRARAWQGLPMLGIEEDRPDAPGGPLPEMPDAYYGPHSKSLPTSKI